MSAADTTALLAGALLLTLAGGAAAQQPTPRPAPARPAQAQPAAPPAQPAQTAQAPQAPAVDQNPQRTTATYGDWIVRCEVVPGPPPKKTCDMEQLAQMQGQTNPISRVAVALPAKGETAKFIIQLPVNVSLATPVKLMSDSKDAGFTTPFRRCVPAGCFAEVELKDDLQKKFRASADPGKMTYKDAADRDVAIPLSFKGFAQAFEALLKQ